MISLGKALKMGQTSATGGFHLFIGRILSTVFLAIGTIILQLLISEGDYGLYTVALIPASALLLFQDWGISSAMIRKVANCRAMNKTEDLRSVIISGLAFQAVTGLILTVLSFLMANFVASTIFGKPESAFLITVASVSIFSTALILASQSIFVGFERMKLSSLVTVCHAVAQFVMVPLLVYFGFGALGATIGYSISLLVAGIVGLVTVYFGIWRRLSSDNTNKVVFFQSLKPMLKFGVPLAIATLIGGMLTQFYSFMMATYCELVIIGNYRTAINFALFLGFFTIPISTVLFPAFSKLDPKNELKLLKTVFESSVKYTALLLVPATMALMVFSKPIIGTLYGAKWLDAPLLLSLFVISNLFAIFGNLSMGSLLPALGKTKLLIKLNLLSLSVGVPMGFMIIPTFGIIGVIFVTLVAVLPSMFLGLFWLWKHFGIKADFSASARVFIASSIAALTSYLFLYVFNMADWVRLLVGLPIFLSIYIVSVPLIGAISNSDIANVRSVFSNLRIISTLIEVPLRIVEKILRKRSSDTGV